MAQTFPPLTRFLIIFTIALPAVHAGWRYNGSPLVTTRLDPVLSPGKVSSYVHDVIGTSNFGPTYNYDEYRNGSCSSVEVQADKSAYWMPAVYGRERNGSLRLLRSMFGLFYLHRGQDQQAFPKGFAMVSGDGTKNARNASSPADLAVNYACIGGSGPETFQFPTQKCDAVRAQIMFPSCWNGQPTSPNGRDHVAYPTDGKEGRNCPSTHPTRLVTIYIEHYIYMDDFSPSPGSLVLSNGDTIGWSDYAGFTSGWDQAVLQQAIKDCTSPFSDLGSCAVLSKTVAKTEGCKAKKHIPYEDVGLWSTIPKLPGDNDFWGGGVAKVSKGAGATPPFALPYSIVNANWNEFGCINKPGNTALSGFTLTDTKKMTQKLCVDTCDSKNFRIAGIEGSGTCTCGNALEGGAALTNIGIDKCSQQCTGNKYEACGDSRKLRIFTKSGTGATTPTCPYPPAGAPFDNTRTMERLTRLRLRRRYASPSLD